MPQGYTAMAHVWGIKTPHLFSESFKLLGYRLLSFCFNTISPNLCVWESSPRSVRAVFGWPSKVIQRIVIWVWWASKGGQHLPNPCQIRASLLLLPFFLSRRASWISAFPASTWSLRSRARAKAAILHNSDTVMQYIYPLHHILIFNVNQRYHAARVPPGETLCDREKPQIKLSLNWGVLIIFLLVIVMARININKTPRHPSSKTSEVCIYYCLCATDSLKNS